MEIMANKIYSNYSQHNNSSNNNELIIETGNTHFACLVLNKEKNKISALEWFKHEKQDGAHFEELLHALKQGSVLLDKSYNKTHVYINNGSSVLIPGKLYNEELIDDYLNVVAGSPINNVSFVDEIEMGESIKNAYRVDSDILKVLDNQFSSAKITHTFSRVLTKLHEKNISGAYMAVQFYETEILIVIINNGILQFIQSFDYTLGDDVLYYLLTVVQRLEFNPQHLQVKITGLIDTQSDLYTQLQGYFGNLSTNTTSEEQALYNTGDHPSHYFTHLFNLAI